jgi:aspartate/methionine/tyrosine aminotransferase
MIQIGRFGFTGVRCGFTVLPKSLVALTSDGKKKELHQLWHRRFTTKFFNSVSYPVQRGAEAIYTPSGQEQVRALVRHYLRNAEVLEKALRSTGLEVFGGKNAPYIWVKAPCDSWQVFDKILNDIQVVITPGAGSVPQVKVIFECPHLIQVRMPRKPPGVSRVLSGREQQPDDHRTHTGRAVDSTSRIQSFCNSRLRNEPVWRPR